jgi:hypothetical protein
MPIIASAKSDGQDFQPAPAGVHQAVCVDVIDLGILDVTWQGQKKQQHKVNFVWQIAEDREDGKPFLVFNRYTLSLSEKANLRKHLESWRGRAFTPEESAGFDLENVIGKNCLLNIQHKPSGDKVYANVVSIMPLAKGMQPITARDYVRKKDRTEEQHAASGPVDHEPPPLTDDDIPF